MSYIDDAITSSPDRSVVSIRSQFYPTGQRPSTRQHAFHADPDAKKSGYFTHGFDKGDSDQPPGSASLHAGPVVMYHLKMHFGRRETRQGSRQPILFDVPVEAFQQRDESLLDPMKLKGIANTAKCFSMSYMEYVLWNYDLQQQNIKGYFDLGRMGMTDDPSIVQLWELGSYIPQKREGVAWSRFAIKPSQYIRLLSDRFRTKQDPLLNSSGDRTDIRHLLDRLVDHHQVILIGSGTSSRYHRARCPFVTKQKRANLRIIAKSMTFSRKPCTSCLKTRVWTTRTAQGTYHLTQTCPSIGYLAAEPRLLRDVSDTHSMCDVCLESLVPSCLTTVKA